MRTFYVNVVRDGVDNPIDALVGVLLIDAEDMQALNAVLVSIEEEYRWGDTNNWDSFEEYLLENFDNAKFMANSMFLVLDDEPTIEGN